MKGTLAVLMWKHLVVRIRRFIHTPIEILSTAVLFIAIYSFKDILVSSRTYLHEDASIQIPEAVELKAGSGHETINSIYYTPHTDLTSLLMTKVQESLTYKEKYSYAMMKPRIIPAIDEIELQKYSKDVEEDAAFVLLPNISETWPQKLEYTIRIKRDYNIYTYLPSDGDLYRHEFYGTLYEPFMTLQWAIDSNYLELLTGNNITQKVTLREFPYAKSQRDAMAKLICNILKAVCYLSLILAFVFLMARLLEERITGIQELIKMVGVSNNMLAVSHVLNAAPAGLMYSVLGTVLTTCSSEPILPDSNPLLIFIMLVLHYITVVSLAFTCSYIVNSTQYTETLAVVLYVVLYVPANVLVGSNIPRAVEPFVGLLPHAPMLWFWSEVAALQQYGKGLSFSNMASRHGVKTSAVLACYLFMIIQACIFFFMAWYLAKVRPGPYGQPLPWGFICQKDFWSKKKVTPEEEEELEELDGTARDEYFEQAPKDMHVGIKIVDVSKVFKNYHALKNVSLDVYQGEITVLLGHNGAGKTTLMSIITGMLSATEGKVYVEGLDTVTQKYEMHKVLGLCPQHNLFFPDLTVLEHVIFFTLLKGSTYGAAKQSSLVLLDKLNIANKANNKSGQLSGGMKRRLQLACALAGDSKVLVLDEPTSGLDVETRRGLWDLLLSLRGSRTVLLSTHFMEEAEALGDRVAALHAGHLRCHATPMYLKRALGTGYRLTFTTIGIPNEAAITQVITSKIPEASVKEKSLNFITYNLPSKSSDKFPKVFTLLESKRSELGIDSIGVGVSTLEEVFLTLCSDVTTTFSDDRVDGEATEPMLETQSGFPLYFHQLLVLIMRQLKFLWFKKIPFFILQVILPIGMICFFTIITNNKYLSDEDPKRLSSASLDLDLYKDIRDRRVLYNVNISGLSLRSLGEKYPKVEFQSSSDIASAVLRTGQTDILEYHQYLVGIELNNTHATVLFTTVVRHAAPVALNLLTNIIALQLLPYADGQTVTTHNYPIIRASSLSDDTKPRETYAAAIWTILVVFISLSTLVNASALPCSEREAGARLAHVLAGCPRALHWAATLLTHGALYALVLALPTVLAALAFDRDRTIDQADFLGALFTVLILGNIAFLALIYIVSFYFKERGASVVLIAMIFAFGFFTPTIKSVSDSIAPGDKDFSDYILDIFKYTMPPHTLTVAAIRCATVACANAVNPTKGCYFCIRDGAPGELMVALFVQFLFYMSVVIVAEYGVFNVLLDRVVNMNYRAVIPAGVDEMVRAENAYVEKAITLPKDQIPDAMLVNDIHKNYIRIFGKSCNAVKGLSFSVKKGECFGLLGVNGAGKSTTFKMLTGLECTTRGSIFANGHFKSVTSTKYLHSLGYCPQFFGLDSYLTGHENLKLILTLRGLTPSDVLKETKAWIDIVGLEKHAHKRVSGYSGGCSRRLATAAALCCGGAVTLLDEPTAGVDVAARRRVWAALRRAAPSRAVVVTSHSMDEMEALCNRIAIMVSGRVRALDSPAGLRAAHAAGHAVVLKLRSTQGDETDSAETELNRLKAALHARFNCTLRDEHKTMLHYHINDMVTYSNLFHELERLKEQFPFVEDYSVTETTLEEVFLSFAREENPDEPVTV